MDLKVDLNAMYSAMQRGLGLMNTHVGDRGMKPLKHEVQGTGPDLRLTPSALQLQLPGQVPRHPVGCLPRRPTGEDGGSLQTSWRLVGLSNYL